MKDLALKIPLVSSTADIPNTAGGLKQGFNNLGDLISGSMQIAFLIAGVLLFFWLVWGVFQYIFAGGNKEALGKARSRITLAIVGFLIVALAFTLSNYIKEIFPPQKVPVQQITAPQ